MRTQCVNPCRTSEPNRTLRVTRSVRRSCAEQPVAETGLDSIGAAEVIHQVSRMAGGKKLPATFLYDYPTAREIALHVMPNSLEAPVKAPNAQTSLPATTTGHTPSSAGKSGQPLPDEPEAPRDAFGEATRLVSSISSMWTQLMPWSESDKSGEVRPSDTTCLHTYNTRKRTKAASSNAGVVARPPALLHGPCVAARPYALPVRAVRARRWRQTPLLPLVPPPP
jgi:hypothetical protein